MSVDLSEMALSTTKVMLFYGKGEKSAIALRREHPELKDVWGDLEASIPVVVPQKAEQPKNLKLSMLPFQLEGLFWMKKQEKGTWKGGMLAVSSSKHNLCNSCYNWITTQDEMG